jgi:Kef-type K+ transport system membrane component KefB
VAQLGVQLLLFTLGLEFSMSKLRAVRNVALLGGLLQTALFAVLAAVGAKLIGTSPAQVRGGRGARAGSKMTAT